MELRSVREIAWLRSRLMRLLACTILLANLISGCSDIQGGKLLAPGHFGLNRAAPGLYVEAGTDAATREQLLQAREHAMRAIRAAYGNVTSSPIINACVSESCYQSFGGQGSTAKIYGNRILLSPRGLDWHFIAHEWSHDESRKRLSFGAWWRRSPQWFDEGLAVAISEAPEHSEAHWLWLVQSNIPRPTREELHTFKSLRQWWDAVHRYGETGNAQRRLQGLPEIRPVYAAAGHEVRAWMAVAGTPGLLQLIQQLNDGKDFDQTYHVIDATVVHEHW